MYYLSDLFQARELLLMFSQYVSVKIDLVVKNHLSAYLKMPKFRNSGTIMIGQTKFGSNSWNLSKPSFKSLLAISYWTFTDNIEIFTGINIEENAFLILDGKAYSIKSFIMRIKKIVISYNLGLSLTSVNIYKCEQWQVRTVTSVNNDKCEHW